LECKAKIYTKKTLKQITKIYKTTLTKFLQVEINIILINIYLSKLIQKLIINIESRIVNIVIAKTIQYICDDWISRNNRKSKLRKTFLQLKQK